MKRLWYWLNEPIEITLWHVLLYSVAMGLIEYLI
jgi:hypothetical protein